MLQGYFDDSGSDPKHSIFTLAGYVFPAEGWASFADEWDKVLKQKPKINYFKMSEAFAGGGAFGTLSSEFRKAKTRDLIAVIKSHRPDGIGVYLTWAEWSKFAAGLKSSAKDQPYSVLFFQLIDEIVAYEKSTGIYPEKAQIDFDKQGAAGSHAIAWYGKLMAGADGGFSFHDQVRSVMDGTPRMLDDKDYLPLQASDMLAGAFRRDRMNDSPRWEWLFPELEENLWGGSGLTEVTWDYLNQLLEAQKSDPRVRGTLQEARRVVRRSERQ